MLLEITSNWVERADIPVAAECKAMMAIRKTLWLRGQKKEASREKKLVAVVRRWNRALRDSPDSVYLLEGLVLVGNHLGIGVEDPLAFHHVDHFDHRIDPALFQAALKDHRAGADGR